VCLFEDYNDINETLAELQSKSKLMDKTRQPIGFHAAINRAGSDK